ncbi:pre-toxin TG domain-containing protein [Kroppenstedtia eburnea]|uniref:Pre-toxin TG n=1 Tax=Kroppenstedtia eburnea TaxID=714067 RepID=A0A1N7MWC3_9BACL|nr:pre-toxin TG domain-containing protein [Kroppenstedtia eburnea]QKI80700.1 hypothetical protein GXN75_00975 [Kroppenstedtia eburnea]SIS90444.1 Pre-toxin TG [Kroppenstedtia eburnea]
MHKIRTKRIIDGASSLQSRISVIQSKFLLTKDDGPLFKEKDENAALQFAKGAGDVALDFIGFHDAKAAITGVDEDGNEIGWGERLFRGALVVPIAKPVKGGKMALKYGDKALTAGKKNLDDVARKGKKTACGCPPLDGYSHKKKHSSHAEERKQQGRPTGVGIRKSCV